MSLRATLAILLLVIGCFWTIRRPFVGVCLVVIFFHLNLRVLGAGLEEIRFQFVITLVLLISYIFNREELSTKPNVTYPPMRWLFAFLGITFITSVWAAGSPDLAFDSAVDFAKIVLFSWLMLKIVKTEKEVTILMYVMFAGMWYVSFMAQWGVDYGYIDIEEAGVATGGTGAHLMMFMPFMILMALYGSWRERIACMVIIPFVLNFLPNTTSGSRSSLVMLVTSMVFMIIFAPGKMRLKIIGPILASGAVFIFVLTPPQYWEDMASILAPTTESSANSRFIINQATFEIINDYPEGVGYNNYSLISMKYLPEEVLTEEGSRDAHNSYLKVLAEFGFVGFLIWIVTFILAWRDFRQVRKTIHPGEQPSRLQVYALAFELGMLGITVGIYTHSYNDLDTLYWFVAFSGIIRNLFERQNEAQPPAPAEVAPQARVTHQLHRAAKPATTATA